jgi:hypothetical protein
MKKSKYSVFTNNIKSLPQDLKKYQGGGPAPFYVKSAQDPRNLAYIDSTRAGQQSLAGLMNDIRVGDIPPTMTNGQPIRRVEDLARANPNLMRIGAGRASGVNIRANLRNGDPNGLDANMPLSGVRNKPVITLDGPAFMSNDYYRMPRQQVIVGEDPALKLDKKDYLSIPVRSPNTNFLKELDEPPKVREIPREKPAMVDQNFSSAELLRILKKPSGYINKGDGKGNLPKFELGGVPPERKPKIYTNKAEFNVAQQAYSDSLELYNDFAKYGINVNDPNKNEVLNSWNDMINNNHTSREYMWRVENPFNRLTALNNKQPVPVVKNITGTKESLFPTNKDYLSISRSFQKPVQLVKFEENVVERAPTKTPRLASEQGLGSLPTTTKIPNSISFAKSQGSYDARGLSRFNPKTRSWEEIPKGWFNKGKGMGIEEKK